MSEKKIWTTKLQDEMLELVSFGRRIDNDVSWYFATQPIDPKNVASYVSRANPGNIEALLDKISDLRQQVADLKEIANRMSESCIAEFRNAKDEKHFECQLCEHGFYETLESVEHDEECPVKKYRDLVERLK